MKGQIETPRISKLALTLLTHLFFDVIMTLEKESSNQVVFQKQLAIKRCLEEIKKFILTNSYGVFHIEILSSTNRDIRDPLFTLTFKNYESEVVGKTPLEYHIILDETYTSYEVYQSSISGIHIKIESR